MHKLSFIFLILFLISCAQDSSQTQISPSEQKAAITSTVTVGDIEQAVYRFNISQGKEREKSLESLSSIVDSFYEDEEDAISEEETTSSTSASRAQLVFDLLKTVRGASFKEYSKIFSNIDLQTDSPQQFVEILTKSDRTLNPVADFFVLQFLSNIKNFVGSTESEITFRAPLIAYYSSRLAQYRADQKMSGRSERVVTFLSPILNFAPIMPSELIWEMAQLFYNIEVNSASTDNVKTAFQKIAESLSDMYSNDPANQLPAISLAMKRSLLFVINHHLQLSTNPSLSLAFIQKSLKLIRLENSEITINDQFKLLTDEHFLLNKLAVKLSELLKQKTIHELTLGQEFPLSRLEMVRQKALLLANIDTPNLSCHRLPFDQTNVHKNLLLRGYFENIECRKLMMNFSKDEVKKRYYQEMLEDLLKALATAEIESPLISLEDLFSKDQEEDNLDNLQSINRENPREEIDSVVLPLSRYDRRSSESSKMVPAGIYYSNKNIIIEGENLLFHPLAIIVAPGKKISFGKFDLPVKIEDAWIDVSGLKPFQAQSKDYTSYYSLQMPTQSSVRYCAHKEYLKEVGETCLSEKVRRVVLKNQFDAINHPEPQNTGLKGEDAGTIDLTHAEILNHSFFAAAGGRGGKGAQALPAIPKQTDLIDSNCQEPRISGGQCVKDKGMEEMICAPRVTITECTEKVFSFTPPTISHGLPGEGGKKGKIHQKTQRESGVLISVALFDGSKGKNE